MHNTLEFHIPDGAWADASGDYPAGSRLLTTVYLNGVAHHFEAREVIEDDAGQRFAAWSDDADLLAAAHGAEGTWQTVDIAGREYAVFASPHC